MKIFQPVTAKVQCPEINYSIKSILLKVTNLIVAEIQGGQPGIVFERAGENFIDYIIADVSISKCGVINKRIGME